MEKIKSLNRYQKGVLILMMILILVFTVVYFMTTSRVGYKYEDAIFIPSQQNGGTVYSGKLQGQQARFTVSEDKTVTFEYGEKTYGPYIAKEDPTAPPKDPETAEYMTGVELCRGEDILFRGGLWKVEDTLCLCSEDGISDIEPSHIVINGIVKDENGNIIDPAEPSVYTILELMNDPKLTHKGQWLVWLIAVAACILNALYILFADELFRLELAFQAYNIDHAEPSDWNIAGRYIIWTFLPIAALVLFIMGLR